jgi:hypothetical protein
MAIVSVYVDGYVVPVNKVADWRTRPRIKHPWNRPAVEWSQWTDWIEIAATLEFDVRTLKSANYFLGYTHHCHN